MVPLKKKHLAVLAPPQATNNKGVYDKQGATKAETTVGVGADRAFTSYSVPLESGPSSGAYRGSPL